MEAGDLGKPFLKLAEDLGVTGGLGGRNEGMEPSDLLPRDGEHLGRGVELHRA